MTKPARSVFSIVAAISILCSVALAIMPYPAQARIGNEIIYQIVTDRFFDGDPANNCGANDPKLTEAQRKLDELTCDPSKKDWNKYWGGDFEGILRKLPYLKELGVTQLWISPVIENARGFASGDGTLKTSYHGFWGRDWFRLNEHWTRSGTEDLDSFRKLVAEARKLGIGVMVDTVANHTSPAYDAEYGALYENGRKITDYLQDSAKAASESWFHKEPGIQWGLVESDEPARSDFLKEYMFQHEMRHGGRVASAWPEYRKTDIQSLRSRMLQTYKLADLADMNSENQEVKDYFNRAHRYWLDQGISGYRIDSVRHVPQSYWRQLVQDLASRKEDLILVGEWFGGGPGNSDSMEFVRNTGMSIFDFRLRGELRELFLGRKDLSKFAGFVGGDPRLVDEGKDLVTFVDNHDLPRMQADGATPADVMEMMKILFAVRGVPCIYYGLEMFLFNTTDHGRDPYNRDVMVFPADGASAASMPGVALLKALSGFRKAHPALRFGTTRLIEQKKAGVLIFRELHEESVLITIARAGRKLQLPAGYRQVELPGIPAEKGKTVWAVRYFLKNGDHEK